MELVSKVISDSRASFWRAPVGSTPEERTKIIGFSNEVSSKMLFN
jgi:hypothetical protein